MADKKLKPVFFTKTEPETTPAPLPEPPSPPAQAAATKTVEMKEVLIDQKKQIINCYKVTIESFRKSKTADPNKIPQLQKMIEDLKEQIKKLEEN